MPAFTASAPGKIILFGEHAVVYGRPAIAVPVEQVQARAVVMPDLRAPRGRVRIQAPDIDLDCAVEELPDEHALRRLIQLLEAYFQIDHFPACILRVSSTIPIAAGLGSGAAISVASLRALSAFLGAPLPVEQVSALAYEIEKLYHGTPSGIDNTVVAYAQPIYFVHGMPVEFLSIRRSFTLVIGDTGRRSPTSGPVGALRQAWLENSQPFETMFDRAGEIVRSARSFLEAGTPLQLGRLMDENHALLVQLGVSSPELDQLVSAARAAGASGAKLSGGGWGGNMIALVEPELAEQVSKALLKSGAAHTLITQVRA